MEQQRTLQIRLTILHTIYAKVLPMMVRRILQAAIPLSTGLVGKERSS